MGSNKNTNFYRQFEKIIHAGEVEKKMYIILEGEVEVSLLFGEKKVVVAVLKKNDFFGEISLFNDIPRSANVSAITDVKVFIISSEEELGRFLLNNPKFATKMIKILSKRLASTNEILIGKISDINRVQLGM